METNAKRRNALGFACTKCCENINFCDRCNTPFTYLEEKIYCDALYHFCQDCTKMLIVEDKKSG